MLRMLLSGFLLFTVLAGFSLPVFALPDLSVMTDITEDCKVKITLHNGGDSFPASVPVGVHYQKTQDDKGAGGWTTSLPMQDLAPAGGVFTYVPYLEPSYGTFTVQVDVDPNRHIAENDENNNRSLRTFTCNQPAGPDNPQQAIMPTKVKMSIDSKKAKIIKK